MVRTLNRRALTQSGQNGKEALRLVELEKPEVILLDIMLPDMTDLRYAKEFPDNILKYQ